MKLYTLILIFLLTGCAGLSKALNDNELLVYLAVKNSTLQYIEKSADKDNAAEAQRIINAVAKAEAYIGDTADPSLDAVLEIIKAHTNYAKLSIADKSLIDDIITISKKTLENEKIKAPDLNTDSVKAIKSILGSIKAAAQLYI